MTLPQAPEHSSERVDVGAKVKPRFTLREFSGGLGDLGIFLPLAAAMAATNHMDLGVIFLFAGFMNIATGLLFAQPIPVQPMKAIAAVAIAEGLSAGEVAASGMAMGIAMTTLALVGAVNWINKIVPLPVIRGIQAGVGAKLVLLGISWIADLPPLGGVNSILIAVLLGVVLALTTGRRFPIMLIVFAGGLVVPAFRTDHTAIELFATLPTLTLVLPEGSEWITGITRGAIPQLPLTMLNSVLAVCALSSDLFPNRGITPRRMALSVGLMNLLSVPFGGMPMCHGAGGLAAQHRFGARTGGSVVMLGIAKVLFALALGGAILPLIDAYPRSVLGIMIVFAGFALMKPARASFRARSTGIVMLSTAGAVIFLGTLEGVLLGCAASLILSIAPRIRNSPR